MEKEAVARVLSATKGGSSTHTAFGAELGIAVEVTQGVAPPAVQPEGSVGAMTPSKFCERRIHVSGTAGASGGSIWAGAVVRDATANRPESVWVARRGLR